ncbi:MAG: hypothetical protein WBM74_17955 [Polyangiales bacterium]
MTTGRSEDRVQLTGRGAGPRRWPGPAGRKFLLVSGLTALYAVTASRALRPPNAYSIGHWLQSYEHGFIKRGLLGTALRPLLRSEGPEQIRETVALVSFSVFALFSLAMLLAAAKTLRRDNRLVSLALAVVFLGSPFVVFSAHLNGYFDPLIAALAVVAVYLASRGRWLAAGLLSSLGILVHEMYAITGMPMVVFCAALRLGELDARARWRPLLELMFAPTLTLVAVLLSSLLQSDELLLAIREDMAARGVIDKYWVDMSTYHLEHGFLDNLREQHRWAWVRLSKKSLNFVVYPPLIALLLGTSTRLKQLGRTRWIPLYIAFALGPWLMHWFAWDAERIAILPIFTAFLGFFGICVLPGTTRGARPIPRSTVATVLVVCTIAAFANAWTKVPLMDGQRDGEGPFSIGFEPEPEPLPATPQSRPRP